MKRFPHIAGRFGLVLALWVLINPVWAAERACWTHFMGASDSVITDLEPNLNGFWAVGRLLDKGASPRLWVGSLDWTGQMRWQTTLPLKGYQLFPRLVNTDVGLWVIAEMFRPSVKLPEGGSVTASEVWLGLVSPEGRLLKQISWAPNRVNTVQAGSAFSRGGLLLAGLAEVGNDLQSQGWLAALDAKGKLIWQRVLPEVIWLTGLSRIDDEQWLAFGQATENAQGRSGPWLGTFDRQGNGLKTWRPKIEHFTAHAALPDGKMVWLAGEDAEAGRGRLIRFEPETEQYEELPVPGFSVLRVLGRMNGEVIAGGDSVEMAGMAQTAGTPGWVSVHNVSQPGHGRTWQVSPVRHIGRVAQGELRDWLTAPGTKTSGETIIIGAGGSAIEGAWVGCIKPEMIHLQ